MYSCTYSHKNQEGSSLNVNSETSITSISNMKVSPPLLTKHETKSTYHNLSHIKNSSVSQSISPQIYITETTDVNQSRFPHFHDSISPLNKIQRNKKRITVLKKPLTLQVYDKSHPDDLLLTKLAKKYSIQNSFASQTEIKTVYTNPNLPSVKKQQPINMKYTKNNYLSKTKEIAHLYYSLRLKKEQKAQIESNIQKEIESLNQTMKAMESFNKTFENNIINNINASLKELNLTLEQERIVLCNLYEKVLSQKKEINMLESQIKRKEIEKKNIEKWIIFQLEIHKFGKVTNLKEELKKVENGLIFDSIEALEFQLERQEKESVLFLTQYNTKQKELDELKNEYETLIVSRKQHEQILNEQIKEKEKMLELLKLRNQTLNTQYKQKSLSLIPMTHKKQIKTFSSLNFQLPDVSSPFQLSYNQNDLLYSLVYTLYNNCVNNLKNEIPSKIIINFKNIQVKESKLIAMLRSIELSIDYIKNKFKYYHKNLHIYGDALKKIISEIDSKKKDLKTTKTKELELQRYKELKEKIDAKANKKRILPLRKVDLYPTRKFVAQSINIANLTEDNEPKFHDFIYESD